METLSLECLKEKTVWNFYFFNNLSIYIKKEFSFFLQLSPSKRVCGCSHPKPDITSRPLVTAKECFFTVSPRDCTQGFHKTMLLTESTQLLFNPNSELPMDPCPKSPLELLWELFFFTTETLLDVPRLCSLFLIL